MGFVKYGGVCHIWLGFVTHGVTKDTFGFCQIWAWDLSNMGGTDGLISYYYPDPSVPCALFFGICQIWVGFVKYGLAHKGQSAIITQTLVFRVPGFVT